MSSRRRPSVCGPRSPPCDTARTRWRGVCDAARPRPSRLLLPDNSNPFFASVARQIEDAGFVSGYTVILCNSDGNAEKEERYLSVLMAKQIDGLIFAGSSDHARVFARLLPSVPAVLLDREIQSVNVDLGACRPRPRRLSRRPVSGRARASEDRRHRRPARFQLQPGPPARILCGRSVKRDSNCRPRRSSIPTITSPAVASQWIS
ncbi:hypothetical protein ACVOMV_06140 [Mesorhizobium atlanticum]